MLLTDQALNMFGIEKKSLNDPKIFNHRNINRKYKYLAKIYHPDRVDGNEGKFRELCANYGILLAMLDSDQKEEAIKMIKAITLVPEFQVSEDAN